MKVALIARTRADNAAMENEAPWLAEGFGEAADLLEFAGRECYQSWNRPNPRTAHNADYLAHIIESGHLSVLEHGMVSFRVSDASRSFTHELVRHRHLSYSQVSQRFVRIQGGSDTHAAFITPPLYQGDLPATDRLSRAWQMAILYYQELLADADRILDERGVTDRTARIKRAREAARAVLPNMTPTSLVVSGNHRAWREVLARRLDPAADAEMQEFALQVLTILKRIEPAIYQDMAAEL